MIRSSKGKEGNGMGKVIAVAAVVVVAGVVAVIAKKKK